MSAVLDHLKTAAAAGDELASLAADEIERLRAVLETALSVIGESISGYIGCSEPAIEWEGRRDEVVKDIAQLLYPDLHNQQSGSEVKNAKDI